MGDTQPPVGPEGILIMEGSTFAINDLSLTVGPDGGLSASMRPMIAWEVWPLWIETAIDHAAAATDSRRQLVLAQGDDDVGSQKRARLLTDETIAGMVVISSVAFALEAMSRSAAAKSGLGRSVGAKTSAAARVAEQLKQCFEVPPKMFGEWRGQVRLVFQARNEAVHPDAGLRDPMPHPALRAAVPRPAHVYRLENATAAVELAMWTALEVCRHPRPRLGRTFRDATASWGPAAETLRARWLANAEGRARLGTPSYPRL
jgi:hypothetical protein